MNIFSHSRFGYQPLARIDVLNLQNLFANYAAGRGGTLPAPGLKSSKHEAASGVSGESYLKPEDWAQVAVPLADAAQSACRPLARAMAA